MNPFKQNIPIKNHYVDIDNINLYNDPKNIDNYLDKTYQYGYNRLYLYSDYPTHYLLDKIQSKHNITKGIKLNITEDLYLICFEDSRKYLMYLSLLNIYYRDNVLLPLNLKLIKSNNLREGFGVPYYIDRLDLLIDYWISNQILKVYDNNHIHIVDNFNLALDIIGVVNKVIYPKNSLKSDITEKNKHLWCTNIDVYDDPVLFNNGNYNVNLIVDEGDDRTINICNQYKITYMINHN